MAKSNVRLLRALSAAGLVLVMVLAATLLVGGTFPEVLFWSVGAALLTAVVSFLLSGRWFRRFRKLEDGIAKLGEGDLSRRISLEGDDTLAELAEVINATIERLSENQQQRSDQERLIRELELARDLQHNLLPDSPPEYDGTRAAGICEPADFVGGDYFDFIPIDERRLGVVIADVSGKSLPGLMMMLVLRIILRSSAPRHQNALPTLCETNRLIADEMNQGSFITCIYMVYDNLNQTVEVVNAGHNPLQVYRYAEEKVETIKSRGRPLGLLPPDQFDSKLEPVRLRLSRGDCILAYTDGVTESMNERQEIFSEERLISVFTENARLAPEMLVKKIAESAHRFAGSSDQFDDMTVVALRSEGRVFKFKSPSVIETGDISSEIDRALTESRPFYRERDKKD